MIGGNTVIKELPKSAKLIVNYMKFEHLINNKPYLTFIDIVHGAGLSPRTVRKALAVLKNHDLIKTVIDVSRSRKYLYQLIFKNITTDRHEVSSGLYVIDLGIGIAQHMTFKMYRVIRQSNILYHTGSIPQKVLMLVKNTCKIRNLNEVSVEEFKDAIETYIIENKGIVTVVTDVLVDGSRIGKYLRSLDLSIPTHYVISASPLQLAVSMLLYGRERKLSFKRGDMTIKVLASKSNSEISNVVNNGRLIKSFIVLLNDYGISLKELNYGEIFNHTINDMAAYILYLKT